MIFRKLNAPNHLFRYCKRRHGMQEFWEWSDGESSIFKFVMMEEGEGDQGRMK